MIRAENISKSYAQLNVLKNVSLEINKGEIVALVGASGAGKSTLLHILGTLDQADEGRVTILNESIKNLSEKALSAFRNKNIGFVFQFHHLLPEFTALENVCIPAFIHGEKKSQCEKRASELLDLLGLSQRTHHKPSELSGGEQQRVAVARALMNSPAVIMADEPSGNLDSANASELHSLFFDLRKKFDQTFIIATHNKELADMADRRLLMRDGRIVSEK